jgi:hypothetical protein
MRQGEWRMENGKWKLTMENGKMISEGPAEFLMLGTCC